MDSKIRGTQTRHIQVDAWTHTAHTKREIPDLASRTQKTGMSLHSGSAVTAASHTNVEQDEDARQSVDDERIWAISRMLRARLAHEVQPKSGALNLQHHGVVFA